MAEDLAQRRWTSEQKLALVAETLRPWASPTQIARRYGISTGLLYTWRRLVREGELSLVPVSAPTAEFVPVEIVPEAAVPGWAKLRESLANRFDDFRQPAADAASGGGDGLLV
jgi:transposase-like protein